MLKLYKINKLKLYVFLSFLLYALAIAIGAVKYLPYQTYAPGVFKSYSVNGMDFLLLIAIALFGAALLPKKIEKPSDWFLIIFVIFLLIPGVSLGVSSDNLSIENKFVILPSLIASISMLVTIRNIKIFNVNDNVNTSVENSILYGAVIGWVILFILLIIKYYSVMKFSGVDEIYEQREATNEVSVFWGYIQLYFTFVFSTLLIAFGLNSGKWLWFALGSVGYFTMYLITAERSQLVFPIFFICVNYLSNKKNDLLKIISIALITFSIIIFGVVCLGEEIVFFDLAGFYLFSRLIAAPSQFVLDYYDFFSTNGFTFFSQIRGFNLLIDAPAAYAANPKWPQLGWIVGSEVHGIQSNSNATFIATDGAASLGALGILLVSMVLCVYLTILNKLSRKFPKPFWSIIFAQQAFVLISGSLFSMLLSFGGFLFLILFILYQPRPPIGKEAM